MDVHMSGQENIRFSRHHVSPGFMTRAQPQSVDDSWHKEAGVGKWSTVEGTRGKHVNLGKNIVCCDLSPRASVVVSREGLGNAHCAFDQPFHASVLFPWGEVAIKVYSLARLRPGISRSVANSQRTGTHTATPCIETWSSQAIAMSPRSR